jgi:uncharacterized protein YbjT (DUF2867 family)
MREWQLTDHPIIIAGASGLVGGALVRALSPRPVLLLVRRHLPAFEAIPQIVAEPDAWPEIVRTSGAVVAISTLGTTIRQAGSKDAFAAVDRDLVIAFAKAARVGGARQFLMISSVGANAASSTFYLKTKGEAEQAVAALGFERLDIFRPGLLRGDRSGPIRAGERIAMVLSPVTDRLTPGAFDRYRSIAALDVAAAMAASISNEASGVHIHENRAMLALAARR